MVAHILDLGTSGAYYIAQAADRIVAQPTTVTGSIGVILVRPSVSGLLGKIGVETAEITSGPHKAMGSPFRPLADDDRALFQTVIDDLYGRFVDAVVAGRPQLARDRIMALADGRIYTAEQARSAGLVDGIGYLDDAVDSLRDAAGLTSATVVTYTRPGQYKGSIYAAPVVNIDLDLWPGNQRFCRHALRDAPAGAVGATQLIRCIGFFSPCTLQCFFDPFHCKWPRPGPLPRKQ